MSEYQTGTYVNGDQTRIARTPAEAVKAVWDGFSLQQSDSVEDAKYSDLQARAKALGIPARGTKEELADAIQAEESSSADA